MSSYVPVIKNGTAGAIFYVSLVSQANTKIMQVNPTIASGDFKVSIDGGALASLGTLPTVTPVGGSLVKITLSQAEVNGDNITVVCLDAAGAEWCDLTVNIQTVARQLDSLAFPNTSGRGIVVDVNGLVDANVVKLGPTGAGTAQTAADVGGMVADTAADLDEIITTLASNLDVAVSSRLASVSYTAPLDSGQTRTAIGLASPNLDTQLAQLTTIKAKTDLLPASPAAVGSAMTLTAAYDFAKGTVAPTESYAANGAVPTPVQALMGIHQMLMDFSISGTAYTVKKLDHSTAFVATLNDATTPTALTRT